MKGVPRLCGLHVYNRSKSVSPRALVRLESVPDDEHRIFINLAIGKIKVQVAACDLKRAIDAMCEIP